MDERRNDWLSKKHTEIHSKVTTNTVPYLDSKLKEFGMKAGTLLGDWYINEFKTKALLPYLEAYDAWADPSTRTTPVTTLFLEAEKNLVAAYRELYRLLKANPYVTDAHLERMAFPKRPDGKRTPAPIAPLPPGFSIHPLISHRLRIDYYRTGEARKRARPKGQRGVEIKWEFSDIPVDNPEQMTHSTFATATPATLAFDPDDAGRRIYLALRWENTRGKKGPWSLSETVNVP
ncbi:MAG: hypothetical protein LBS05_00225 [Tannerellaceae bacterium]|nr:hypothetical protein [Tannerellaceae bacterium]